MKRWLLLAAWPTGHVPMVETAVQQRAMSANESDRAAAVSKVLRAATEAASADEKSSDKETVVALLESLRAAASLDPDQTSPRRQVERSSAFRPGVRRFVLDEQWEGRVVEVGPDRFKARVLNLSDGRISTMSLPLTAVDTIDQTLVEKGATFYVCRGRTLTPLSQKERAWVWFRRLPPWTPRQLSKWREGAAEAGDDEE